MIKMYVLDKLSMINDAIVHLEGVYRTIFMLQGHIWHSVILRFSFFLIMAKGILVILFVTSSKAY